MSPLPPDSEHRERLRESLHATARGNHDAPPRGPVHWPKPMANEAFVGPAGEFVRLVEPTTEADRHGLLLQFLAACGCLIGRGPGLMADGAFHPPRLWSVLVGASAKSRKGTSWERVREPLELVEPDFVAERIDAGLSSGEGLAYRVRDAQIVRRKAKKGEQTDADGMVEEIADPGVEDKRLLVVETEFAQPFKVMQREGNTLSIALRNAWDGKPLGGLTKRDPTRAKRHSITVIGHITVDEARRVIADLDVRGGVVNRFLFCCVKRARLLPRGGFVERGPLERLSTRLSTTIAEARRLDGPLDWTDEAGELWDGAYERLTADRPGLLGDAVARAESQTLRLALVYCLLDRRTLIDVEHLRAALAVWGYCERSAAYVFGERTGDPLADRFLAELRRHEGGRTRTDLREVAGGDRPAERIEVALDLLNRYGLAHYVIEKDTGGAPAERWFATRNEEQ
jgi:hypothetical protein